MKFKCYSKWSQLPAGVDSLFDHSGDESMFLTREWFEALDTIALEDGQSLLLTSVVDEESVLALLPLIGEGEYWQSVSHRYTAIYSLLLAAERQPEVLACLAEGLSQHSIHSLQLSPVAEDDHNILGLQQALATFGYEPQKYFFFYNWIHRTQQHSFDAYMAGRPAQLRNTITRKQRKLEREHECKIRMFKGDEVQQGLIDYHSAYSASWKANEQYVALLDAVAINLSVPDWTRIAVLYIDGKAAAAQLWFVVHGQASIFRLAYDEEWKRYSPGSILTAYLMQYVIEIDKVEEIDFLTGNEAYKRDWMSLRRERWRLLFIKQNRSQGDSSTLMAMLKNGFKRIFNK
ncbi:MAG: GNAT family N-acetyltransferase [Gammaproteobacteria bacterium]|uniref:GNAT family N-acetyltransferase n=1 Tax=Candidatus Thiopontia autotrophica TaxID=2841688 RepID=A0A8J6TRW7_9GAMM|nr:GNAT family N-acetyltransferase [Candidatus Thiopontia autotrophica]